MADFDRAIPDLELSDLNRQYTEGENCDKRLFSEMRTNLQLVAGQHYFTEGGKYWSKIRNSKQLTDEQRLKLTKNHLQRITKIYRNMIESMAPGVEFMAANEKELQDQKAAELAKAYWAYTRECSQFPELVNTWIKNFVEIGEVGVKILWDMNGGQDIGRKAATVQDAEGNIIVDEDEWGNPMASDEAVYSGKIKFDTFECFNLRRDPSSRSMADSPFLTLSKILSKRKLRTFLSTADAKELLDSVPTDEYNVFDNNTNTYRVEQDQVLVKETYYRPAPNIPNGYYFIYTGNIMIEKGELPYGIFPIVHAGFDEQTGNPRSHSILRHCRSPQVEINRCGSAMAEHQVTLGADKVWIPATTKVNQGAMLPGIRVNTYSGMKPEIVPGRSGAQYLEYLNAQIDELYKLANLEEMTKDQPESQDLYANLLKSYRFKRKFALYGEKFERFLIEVAKTAIKIAKASASERELVPAIGKAEYINMSEFKNLEDFHYQIKVLPRSNDVESQFGKQITLNHVMQYLGKNLDKEDIGKMLRLSPFLNQEQMFEDFTMKYDNVVNDLLAMDRGQFRQPRRYDDHKYIMKALTSRMSKSDFEFLAPQIKAMYEQKLQMHEQMEAQALKEIQRAKDGFIPSGGFLAGVDLWGKDPKDPLKTKRVRIPSESLNWLIKRLDEQGTSLKQLEEQPVGVMQDIGRMIGPGGAPPPPMVGGLNG